MKHNKKNKLNDIFKNKLAKDNNLNIIRFWESDINNNNYKNILNKLWEK